jgi:aminopeptidase-like protein
MTSTHGTVRHLASAPRTRAPGVPAAPEGVGGAMHAFVGELFPICRSITGDGFRETLRRVAQRLPLQIHEVPTGTRVFDWTVPREWNIRDAYVKNSAGERVIDFRRSNLHVVSYSVPVRATMSLAELRPHLFSLPDRPDWIPYRTSYYDESWGFCLSHNQLLALPDDRYEVCIDSTLADGHLTYGEHYVAGELADEVLISCHSCHPSLANDNLSGVALATFLAGRLGERTPRYSYRFLFLPVTIGAITWLARNEEAASRVRHGLVVACVGDAGRMTYKRSRRGNAEIDRAVAHVLAHSGAAHELVDFFPYGYDERQYCSPGFDLPVGCLMRTPHGQFPEYHTSADDLDFVRPEALADSLATYLAVIDLLEHNRRYLNLNPKCEPQLGKRGLYERPPGPGDPKQRQLAMLWVLNASDGGSSLLDIAERSGIPFDVISDAADALLAHGLLAPCAGGE